MAKAVLFYAMVHGYHPHGHGFRLLAVTSEKGRQVYGREVDTYMVTHRSDRDVLHRWAPGTSLEYVQGAFDRAARMKEKLQETVDQAERTARSLRAEMMRQVMVSACGESPNGRCYA